MTGWINSDNIVGFYGPYYPSDFIVETHLAIFQLLPVQKLQDLGKPGIPVPSMIIPGLLNTNQTLLVQGGPCNKGYTLSIYDLESKILTYYYWDEAGRPSDGSKVCVGHDGGPNIITMLWIDTDVFLSVNFGPDCLVKYTLNPVGFTVIPYPNSATLWVTN